LSFGKKVTDIVTAVRFIKSDDDTMNRIKKEYPAVEVKTIADATAEDQAIQKYIQLERFVYEQEQIQNIQEAVEWHKKKLFDKHSNLNMIKICPVIGRRFTVSSAKEWAPDKALCIVILCSSKGIIPLNEEHFPSSLTFNDNTFQVDVREGYMFLGHTYRQYADHLWLGCSIGRQDIMKAGSIGPFVVEKNNPEKCGFLTCYHVLFDSLTPPSEEMLDVAIVQPSDLEQVQNTICGKVINTRDELDAVYVRITDPARCPDKMYFPPDSEGNN